MRELTRRCVANAEAARHRALKYASYYEAHSEEFRKQAARARSLEMRAGLLRIAASYEDLAQFAEAAKRIPGSPSDPADDRAAAGRAEIARERAEEPSIKPSTGDAIAQARRHVAEGQERIERQESLIARLSSDSRHGALAAEAKEILETLKHTLSLAQHHLDLELKKRSQPKAVSPPGAEQVRPPPIYR